MSTLTSAQLHVKRSSTRLHAPPGGASSLTFGCGGLGTAEPAEESSNKDEPAYARPSSGRYAPSTTSFSNNNGNTPSGGYPSYSSSSMQQPDPAPCSNFSPSQPTYQQQQPYQYQPPYNSSNQSGYNYGNNSFLSNSGYANSNGFQAGRPPSSAPSSRSSARSSSSSSSWGSQPPLTSSKRDQNSSSTWSNEPAGGALDDGINPPSPLSKFMHQHAQQQQQLPPTPGVDYQRLGTASSTRSSSNYMQPSYPSQSQAPGPGYPAGVSFSRAGVSTASSMASSATSSRRQPPGGQCQWSLG